MGRGNGAITYSTRSGTNKFSGSAVWSIMNTSLNPNSWTNNRNQTPAYPGGPAGVATRPDWSNTNQGTVSFGGPIIKQQDVFLRLVRLLSERPAHIDELHRPDRLRATGNLPLFQRLEQRQHRHYASY